MNPSTPCTKEEILSALETVFDTIGHAINAIPEGIFSQKPGQKWSIAEQIAHLIQSCFPVAGALKLPKTQLADFGKPQGPSRSYEALKALYYEKLGGGIQATGAFVPVLKEGTTKALLLENWSKIKGKLLSRLSDWKEEDLDKYVLPHPALGLLTVREMLFFTVFHNKHHLKSIELLEQSFI